VQRRVAAHAPGDAAGHEQQEGPTPEKDKHQRRLRPPKHAPATPPPSIPLSKVTSSASYHLLRHCRDGTGGSS
jgi:hypothetical protein